MISSGNIPRELFRGSQDSVYEIPSSRSAGSPLPAGQSFLKRHVALPGKVFDAVRDFGAPHAPDDASEAIQKAIDAARSCGKGAVAYLPQGTYSVAKTLHVTGGKAYVCDKLQGLEILDVTDPRRPALLGTFKGGGSVVGVRVVDDVALVINWERGLEAIDVRDPARASRIGVFFDGGRPNGLQVVGDLVYLADGSDGLEIIRFRKQSKESHR